MSKKTWYTALTGFVFLIIVIIGIALTGSTPTGTDDSVAKIVEFYEDNEAKLFASVILEAIAAAILVWYGLHLRLALKDSVVSPLITVGTGLIAAGLAIDASLTIALLTATGDPDVPVAPATIQTLQVLYDNDFVLFVVGGSVMALSAGIAIVQTGALPKWLGWVAIVIGVLAFAGPAGFVAIILLVLWTAVTSVILALKTKNA